MTSSDGKSARFRLIFAARFAPQELEKLDPEWIPCDSDQLNWGGYKTNHALHQMGKTMYTWARGEARSPGKPLEFGSLGNPFSEPSVRDTTSDLGICSGLPLWMLKLPKWGAPNLLSSWLNGGDNHPDILAVGGVFPHKLQIWYTRISRHDHGLCFGVPYHIPTVFHSLILAVCCYYRTPQEKAKNDLLRLIGGVALNAGDRVDWSLQEDMSSSQQTPKGPYVPKEVDFNQQQWWVDQWKLGFESDQQENLGKPAPRMVTLTTKEQLSFCHSLVGWCSIQETRAHLVLFIRVASVTYFVALSLYIYTIYIQLQQLHVFLEEAYTQLTFCMFQRPFLGEEKKPLPRYVDDRRGGRWVAPGLIGLMETVVVPHGFMGIISKATYGWGYLREIYIYIMYYTRSAFDAVL